jgi:site-specific DNA-methyltransferase (adenine-specific)
MTKENDFKNTLWYGDNLDILKILSQDKEFFAKTNGGFDLIYIDPPFNSAKNYNILYENLLKNKTNGEKNKAQKEAFADTWSNTDYITELEQLKMLTDKPQLYYFINDNKKNFDFSTISYLTMMAHRLYYIYKVLKNTGSFYLHCDPTMSHYLKVLLDIIFERKNFKNEIVWHYRRWTAKSNKLQELHDIIFFYTKSDKYIFNVPVNYTESSIKRKKQGVLHRFSNGEKFLVSEKEIDEQGVRDNDVWQIPFIAPSAKERLGYPTQKPLELLKKIVKISSNECSYVADFFCGCGTTISAAEQLNRKWFGVDISHLAITLIEDRFKKEDLKPIYEVNGFPKDIAMAEKLAQKDKFKFEEWIVEYVFKGHQTKRTGDGGFDGHIIYSIYTRNKPIILRAIIEVKGGNVTLTQIRAFKDTIETYNADFGIFVAFEKYITDGMKKEANKLGFIENDNMDFGIIGNKPKKMYIITIEDIIANNTPIELKQMATNITY